MSSIDKGIDEIIKRAIESGEFDNLPGTGKPIQWNENPYAREDWRLVEDVLKKNGLSYPWMEKRKEIEQDIVALKEILTHRRSVFMNETEISDQIVIINKKIFDYNLSVPVSRLQMKTINLQNLISPSSQVTKPD